MLGDVRITGESAEGRDIFIGIGETDDVDSYLDRSRSTTRCAILNFDPFRVDYRLIPGGEPPGPPGRAAFWAASASGSGAQPATWDVPSRATGRSS